MHHALSVPGCNHLIIVCCHAIYLSGPTKGTSEDEWLIEPFQRGETPTFIQHVKAGIEVLANDPNGLLIFSGGATKKNITDLAEGQSYLNLAEDNNFFAYSTTVQKSRVIAECYATDSYQNVLFSLLRFRLYTGVYPSRVTVVTHEFKRKRFVECHFPALGLNLEKGELNVIGINPPEEITSPESLVEGEERRGIGLWRKDRYGVQRELSRKRIQRGWMTGVEQGVFIDVGLEPVVEDLIRWDGGTSANEWFSEMNKLPWHRRP